MLSLTARLVLAASLVLVAFLGLTGGALDRAFRQSGQEMIHERLMAQVYTLLAVAETDKSGALRLPSDLPDQRFSVPASGLYAAVFGADSAAVWRSRSMLGVELAFPRPHPSEGELFDIVSAKSGRELFALSFPVAWELADDKAIDYTFAVAEERTRFDAELGRFRRNLWGWFGAAAVGLLAAQGLILSWSLSPLRRVAREVAEIETGRRMHLDPRQPKELRPLTDAVNTLIDSGRRRVERSRNALADLAHSLKTPLAVLRSSSESAAVEPDGRTRQGNGPGGKRGDLDALEQTVLEQVERMDRTVNYQLQRAAAAGRAALSPPVAIAPLAARLRSSLVKVYADKSLDIAVDADGELAFSADEGDLIELLGNLMDNACKWARSSVVVRASTIGGPEEARLGRTGLRLSVEDDGPGIDAAQADRILERGARADAATPGHGIGLAMVREIVCELYQGELVIDASPLGGARIVASLIAGASGKAGGPV